MANGLLNQLLLQQSEQTAPVQKRFNLQNFLTGAVQMSNQIARQEERQRQNSLRNLIAAREKEGIGFDQLSNEAAKYDMNAANTMRDEFRNSYKFNQQQSDAELARFKREMADYWFGEVLRRNRKEGRPDGELKNITYEAASMIAPYDSDLAYKLLRDSEMEQASDMKRAADAAKRNKKPDETKKIDDIRQKNMAINPDFDKDPSQTRENRIRGLAADAVLRWKGKGNPDSENYAHWSGYDRAVWIPMVNTLYQAAFEKFPDLYKNSGAYRAADKWLRGLGEDEIYNIIGGQTIQPETNVNEIDTEIPQETPQVRSGSGNGAPVGGGSQEDSGGVELPKTLLAWSGDNNAKRVNSKAVGQLYSAIPYLVTRKDFEKAGALASELNEMESGEGGSYSKIQAAIEDQRKKIQSELDDLKSNGYNVTEDDFEKYKKLFGARAAQGTLRQFMNFNSGVASYYTDSPLTSMINWLLVAEPNYKANDIEFKNARRLKGSTSQKVRTFLANLNIPVVSKWQDLENDYPALFAAAMGSVNIAREMWSSLTSDMDGEDKEKAEKFMQKMFRIGPEAMSIIKGESDLAYDEDAYQEELAKRKKARKKLPIYSVDGKKDTSSTRSEGGVVYTKKSWEDFE